MVGPVSKVLNRVIVAQFYQRNAGLFLFLFILLFGVVHGEEVLYYHLTLIYAMLDSNLFMAVIFIVWLLYGLKCAQFTTKSLSEPENSFINVIACLSKREQLLALINLQWLLFLPVLIYTLFIISVGIYTKCFGQVLLVIAYNFLLCGLSAVFYRYKIQHPDSGKSLIRFPFLTIKIPKNYPAFFITYLLNELKIIFIVTKFFSATVLIAFLNGFFINVNDSRIPFLGFLLGIIAHCMLVFEFRKFEETRLNFSRNLPISRGKRFLSMAMVYTVVLLPEIIILITSIPTIISAINFILLAVFGISTLLFLHCLLYWPIRDTEVFLKYVFGTFSILFFLILYKAYVAIISMLLLISLLIFFLRYYRYETISTDE
ncbi:MAG: hypothetical protein H0W62_06160 [Chitinophagales bacterium]|nr:hypothetical protein [Chitinophagales bacterium]